MGKSTRARISPGDIGTFSKMDIDWDGHIPLPNEVRELEIEGSDVCLALWVEDTPVAMAGVSVYGQAATWWFVPSRQLKHYLKTLVKCWPIMLKYIEESLNPIHRHQVYCIASNPSHIRFSQFLGFEYESLQKKAFNGLDMVVLSRIN